MHERNARREFVVAAARRLVAEHEVDRIRMEDIADAVDYTRRTLYAYFKSRDDILLLAHVDDLARQRDFQNRAVAGAQTGLQKLLAWGRAYSNYAGANPHSERLQRYWDYTGIEESRFSEEALEQFKEINLAQANDVREIVRSGLEDGSLRAGLNVDMTISHFVYALRSVVHRARASTYHLAHFDPDEFVEEFLALFARGVRKGREAGS